MNIKKMGRLRGDLAVVTGLVLVSLMMLLFSNDQPTEYGLRSVVVDFVGSVTAPLSDFKNLLHLLEENRQLRYLNMTLQLERSRYREAYYENIRLRNLLGFAPFQTHTCKSAGVIGRGNIQGVKTIIIDIGRDRDIRTNMPLASGLGLVGKIVQVSGHTSVGQLLIDHNFRVAARIQRSRDTGIFHALDEESGYLEGVHHRARIVLGDTVVTVGMSSLFPAGIPIGTVTALDSTESELFKKVFIKPFVDFSKLEEVFVILTDAK